MPKQEGMLGGAERAKRNHSLDCYPEPPGERFCGTHEPAHAQQKQPKPLEAVRQVAYKKGAIPKATGSCVPLTIKSPYLAVHTSYVLVYTCVSVPG